MLPIALNLLALLIVLGLCWAAMMWLGGRFHGQSRMMNDAFRYSDIDRTEPPRALGDDARVFSAHAPCTVCEGVGALQTRGKLAACPECLGTGVLSQA